MSAQLLSSRHRPTAPPRVSPLISRYPFIHLSRFPKIRSSGNRKTCFFRHQPIILMTTKYYSQSESASEIRESTHRQVTMKRHRKCLLTLSQLGQPHVHNHKIESIIFYLHPFKREGEQSEIIKLFIPIFSDRNIE